jgi:hypothetical protein
LTRHEHQKLIAILERIAANSRQQTKTILALQEILRDVEQQLAHEDAHNTALEQQHHGADHGDERSL